MKKTGIYRIYNTKTDKSYVGQAIDIEVRWNGHKRELEEGCHHNVLLQRDWNKYGKSSFEFSILTECNPVELNVLEKLYMDLYNCTNAGYNVAEGNKKISKKYREELLSKEKRPNKAKNIKVENIVDKKENDDKKKNTEISSLKLCNEKLREHIINNLGFKVIDEETFSLEEKFFEWYLKTNNISELLPWAGEHGLSEFINFRLYSDFWEIIGELVGENYGDIDMDDKTIKISPKITFTNGEIIQEGDNKYLSYWKQGNKYVFKKIRKREMANSFVEKSQKRRKKSNECIMNDYGKIKVTKLECDLLKGLFEIRAFIKENLKQEVFKPLLNNLEGAISDLIIKSDKYSFKAYPICVIEDKYIISKERNEDEYYILELNPKLEKRDLYEFLLDNWTELADIKFIPKGDLLDYKGNKGLEMKISSEKVF